MIPSRDRRRAHSNSEQGSGTLSTMFGVGVFLVMLMFCSHVLLNLWLTTSIDAVAHDAATDVATSGTVGTARAGAERQALERAREALGGYGEWVEMAFEPASTDTVVLRVTAPEISLLPRSIADVAGLGGLDRRIVVRAERPDERPDQPNDQPNDEPDRR